MGAVAAIAACVVSPSALYAQAQPDTLRGIVRAGVEGAVVAGAEVIVTRAPDRTVFRTVTGSAGRWQLVVESGTGDYLVFVAAAGFDPSRRRVSRAAETWTSMLDLTLTPTSGSTLAVVEVRARARAAPQHGSPTDVSPGASEQFFDGVGAIAPPGAAGDLRRLAGAVPGLVRSASGLSALGLPAAQTLVTLGGVSSLTQELPRGLRLSLRNSVSEWDVSQGGFAGTRIDVDIAGGSLYSSSGALLTLDAPALQTTDRLGRALRQESGRVDFNLYASGMLTRNDRFAYATAVRVLHETPTVSVLTDLDSRALRLSGVAPDTVERLQSLLRARQIPLGPLPSGPSSVFLYARVDRLPFVPGTFQPAARQYGAFVTVTSGQRDGVGASALSLGSVASRRSTAIGSLGLQHSLRTKKWVHDTRAGVSVSRADNRRTIALPSALVRVGSSRDAVASVSDLRFGGAEQAIGPSVLSIADFTHQSRTFLDAAERTQVRIFGQIRVDANNDRTVAGELGRLSYPSLDAFARDQASSYSRTQRTTASNAAVMNSALGIGATVRPSRTLAVQFGLRADGSYGTTGVPAGRRALQSLGVQGAADRSTAVVLSPRMGFQWFYTGNTTDGGQPTMTTYGSQRTEFRGVLRGGAGQFAGYPDVEALARIRGSSGVLSCVGSAVPEVDWAGIVTGGSAPPVTCAAATTGALAASNAGGLSQPWRLPRSQRATLAWSTRLLGSDLIVEGTINRTLNLPSSTDANFSGVIRGQLDAEGGRPVFSPLLAISPVGGLFAPGGSRRIDSLGQVQVLAAAARSRTSQLRLVVTPSFGQQSLSPRVTWLLAKTRDLTTGFDSPTAGNPAASEWAPGALDIRHQLQGQIAYGWQRVSLTAVLVASSGLPFSPIIRGDVNGDEFGINDLAFVRAADTNDIAFTAGMSGLLRSPERHIRQCLTTAIGRVARRNECRMPWTVTGNAQLSLDGSIFRFRENARVNVFVENLAGGLDRILHGQRLRGWGAPVAPDPVLYVVRGWDGAAKTFQYTVNDGFGSTAPQRSLNLLPFRVTLDVSLPLGRPFNEQQLERSLRARDSSKKIIVRLRDSAALQARYAGSVPDAFDALLSLSDSLLLTPEQIGALRLAQTRYRERISVVWASLAGYLRALPDGFDTRAALARQEVALTEAWETARVHIRGLDSILSPLQLQLAPEWPVQALRRMVPGQKLRAFTY